LKSLSNKLNKLSGVVEKDLRKSIEKNLEKIKKRAQKVHRYQKRTGNLANSFEIKMHDSYKGEIILDRPNITVPYTYAIHEGHSGRNTYANMGFQTWRPDRFLTKAGKKLEKPILDDLKNTIKKSVRKAFR